MSADKSLFDLIYGLAHQSAILDWFLVFTAKFLPYLIVIVFLIYLFFKVSGFKSKLSIFLSGTLAVIISRGILTELVRFFIERPRPFADSAVQALISHDITSSFPSGHMAFLTPVVLFTLSLNRKLGIWLGVSTLIVGFGRVAAGVHFPSDILTGIVVGFVGFYLAKLALRKII